MRGRRGIGRLQPLDLRSTARIRSRGGRAGARRRERLTGGAGRAARARGWQAGPGGQRGRGRLAGGAGRAARATGRRGRARGKRERRQAGPAAQREEGGEARARGGPTGPKGRGGRGSGLLCLFLLFWNCFLLFFYLFYLIQIQMSPKSKLDFLRIMHQTKVKSRVQHDATIHTPLGFNIIDYNYK